MEWNLKIGVLLIYLFICAKMEDGYIQAKQLKKIKNHIKIMGEAKKKQQRQFNQKMRFSDGELLLLKYTFSENDNLLYAIRKVFLQFELDEDEQKLIKSLTPEILAIVKKELIPELDPNVPFFQMQDLFNIVNFEDTPEKIDMEIRARMIEKEYLEQQYKVLIGENVKREIILEELLPEKDRPMCNAIVNLSARNMIVRHIETQLNVFKILAGLANETVDQTKERLQRDSNK